MLSVWSCVQIVAWCFFNTSNCCQHKKLSGAANNCQKVKVTGHPSAKSIARMLQAAFQVKFDFGNSQNSNRDRSGEVIDDSAEDDDRCGLGVERRAREACMAPVLCLTSSKQWRDKFR